jgi:excisionase family DNA binding protein
MNEDKLALSVDETARRISVCPKTVHNLIRRGQLGARKIGSRTVVLVTDLQKFLESRKKISDQ